MNGQLTAFLRQWPVILLAAVLGLAGGFGYAKLAPPVYSSTAQVLVSVSSSGSTSDRLQGATYIDQIIPTYTSAITSSLVLTPIINQFDLDTTLAKFSKDVTVTSATGNALFSVSVTGDTAEQARKLTAAVTNRFIAVVPNLVSPDAAASTTPTDGTDASLTPADVSLTVVDAPTNAIAPDSPSLILGLALGLVAGLLVGAAIAFARLWLDTRVRSVETVERIAGAPVIGRLPRLSRSDWDRRDELPDWIEAVRALRSNLFSWGDPSRSIQFVAATPGEGTSSLVASLAVSLARAGVSTVAIDADLRSPSLHGLLQVPGELGLAEVLVGSANIGAASSAAPGLPQLIVVPAGSTTLAGDLVASEFVEPLVTELGAHADIVLVDTPPVLLAGDALAIGHAVSSVILVVGMGIVPEQSLIRTVDQLTGSGRSIAGVVITQASTAALVESTRQLQTL
ncbi:polysaccharide biosynthesis tyrosine autokinase [soil metagenome]